MKNINDLNKTIKYNKLINLIKARYPNESGLLLDYNDKKLFTVWIDEFHYYLYLHENEDVAFYIEFDYVFKEFTNTKFNVNDYLDSPLLVFNKKIIKKESFADFILDNKRLKYFCSADEFFSVHKELL